MKKLILSILIISAGFRVLASNIPVDSLQKQVEVATSDSAKAVLNTQLANSYMNYGVIQDKQLKTDYQEQALKYTMSALHNYSRLDDSTGLRIAYDRLSKIYRDQKKYTQAKWFILQANTLARAQNNLAAVTESLIKLADIKMDIRDFDLAQRDLGEALTIASSNRFSKQQANVMLGYARLYSNIRRPIQAYAAMERYQVMEDSMKKDSADVAVATVIQTKKKFFTASTPSLRKQPLKVASL